jgi:hypothetical protein
MVRGKEPTADDYYTAEGKTQVLTREALDDDVPFIQYATNDVDIIEAVKKDHDLKPLLALYSQLLRLTKVTDKEKIHFQHRVARIFNILKIFTEDESYDAGKWSKLVANESYLRFLINDSHKGYKMERLSKQEKIIRWDAEKEKKKRFWE